MADTLHRSTLEWTCGQPVPWTYGEPPVSCQHRVVVTARHMDEAREQLDELVAAHREYAHG